MWENFKNAVINFLKNGGITLLKVICVLILGILVIKIVMKVLKTIFSKTTMEKITQSFLLSVLRFVLYILLVIIIIQMLNIPITGFIAVISAAGLAIGLALQDSLSNLANGLIIITTKPFREGDYISIDGIGGSVSNIKMLTTCIITPDNKTIILPNSKIVTSAVINFTAQHRRRVTINFGVAYESDVELVKKIVLDVMKSNGKVLLKPEMPFVALNKMNESSIDFFSYCWCDAEDYWDVYFYVTERLFNELKKHNISVPYNQMEVRLRNDKVKLPYDKSNLPERIEKEKNEENKNFFENLIKLNKKKNAEKDILLKKKKLKNKTENK